MNESQPFWSNRTTQIFNRLDQFVLFLSRKPLYAGFFAIFLSLILYGVNSNPGQDYFRMAKNPFALYERAPHFQDSLFLPLSAHFLGLANSSAKFELYTTSALLLAFFAIVYLAGQSFSDQAALFGILTLTLSPVTLICLIWMGLPDPFTVLFSGILAFANSPLTLFVTALLGTTNHPQFLFISVAIIAVRFSAREKRFQLWHSLAIGLGILIGYLAVQSFLDYYKIHVELTRFDLMFQHDIIDWFLVKSIEAPLGIFSLYNGLWFVLALCILYGFWSHKVYYFVFGAFQIAAGVITFFTYDTTRIFSLLTIGMVMHCVVFTYQIAVERGHDPIFRRLLTVLLLLSLFLPHYIMWAGEMLFPRTYKLPALLINLIFGR